jgi:SAM-dependent methyltransferase
VIKALAKGAVQLAFGRTPGGAGAYRALTRGPMGTAESHVDKLARVWPGYAAVWRRIGVELEGAAMWCHDAGATPFMAIAAFALTGRGPALTGEPMRDRYVDRARRGVLACGLPMPDARRARVDGLRWLATAADVLAAVDARAHADSRSIADASIDLVHSGGALEHERPDELRAFLAEQVRVLRPGGVASHVFDHRDHLHHADNALPFHAHLAWPEPAYRSVLGHPLGYHSRLSPAEVARAFEAAGLERIGVRRLIYAGGERRWVDTDEAALAGAPGLPRARLAARFRGWSDADLRTAAAHYLYRRRPDVR